MTVPVNVIITPLTVLRKTLSKFFLFDGIILFWVCYVISIGVNLFDMMTMNQFLKHLIRALKRIIRAFICIRRMKYDIMDSACRIIVLIWSCGFCVGCWVVHIRNFSMSQEEN